MKITSIAVAAALALVPATASFANDAKKEALKKAKEAAKEAAKEKAKERTEKIVEASNAKKATTSAAKPADNAAAQQAERELHARNLGVIERLQQIAVATNDANLKVAVERLNGKEGRRHDLAISTL